MADAFFVTSQPTGVISLRTGFEVGFHRHPGADDERGLPGVMDDDGFSMNDVWIVESKMDVEEKEKIPHSKGECPSFSEEMSAKRTIARILKSPVLASFAFSEGEKLLDDMVGQSQFQLPPSLHLLSMELMEDSFKSQCNDAEEMYTQLQPDVCVKMHLLPHSKGVRFNIADWVQGWAKLVQSDVSSFNVNEQTLRGEVISSHILNHAFQDVDSAKMSDTSPAIAERVCGAALEGGKLCIISVCNLK
eukprot:m.85654 g.85654  ORF g.85654 m.85654 type:complete len:247 (+) comp8750_c0_seq1:2826-3566(+)